MRSWATALLLLSWSAANGFAAGVAPLSERVAALARFTRIESDAVGYGGDPGPAYLAAKSVTLHLKQADARALLHHPSPVVRVYVAEYLATRAPTAAALLLTDSTPVGSLSGCIELQTSVAQLVAEALCESSNADAKAVLAHALRSPEGLDEAAIDSARDCLHPHKSASPSPRHR